MECRSNVYQRKCVDENIIVVFTKIKDGAEIEKNMEKCNVMI